MSKNNKRFGFIIVFIIVFLFKSTTVLAGTIDDATITIKNMYRDASDNVSFTADFTVPLGLIPSTAGSVFQPTMVCILPRFGTNFMMDFYIDLNYFGESYFFFPEMSQCQTLPLDGTGSQFFSFPLNGNSEMSFAIMMLYGLETNSNQSADGRTLVYNAKSTGAIYPNISSTPIIYLPGISYFLFYDNSWALGQNFFIPWNIKYFSTVTVPPYTPASNGVCSATHYSCMTPGVAFNTFEGTNSWAWQCPGVNGGNPTSCTEFKAPICSGSRNTCDIGMVIPAASSTTHWRWYCYNNTYSPVCSVPKVVGVPPTIIASALPNNVAYNGFSTISFSSTEADDCSIFTREPASSSLWRDVSSTYRSGTYPLISASWAKRFNYTTEYRFICTNATDSVEETISVSVLPANISINFTSSAIGTNVNEPITFTSIATAASNIIRQHTLDWQVPGMTCSFCPWRRTGTGATSAVVLDGGISATNPVFSPVVSSANFTYSVTPTREGVYNFRSVAYDVSSGRWIESPILELTVCPVATPWNGAECSVATTPAPDLVANSVLVSNTSVFAGESITFGTGDIINSGNAVADPYTVGGFYIDSDNDGVANYIQAAGNVTGSTAIGGSNSRNGIVWNIPDDAQAGNYRVRYIVDVDNAVSESNEANNSSGWVSFTVTVPPSGMISATPCTIPTDSSNCPSTINWTHSNFVGSPVVEQGGTTFSPPATSPVDRPVNEEPGNRTFVLRDNGSTFTATAFAGGTCETGSVWVSSLGPTGLCAKLPSLEILTNPNIIRSGNKADLVIKIKSNYTLTCIFGGGATGSFEHVASVSTTTYPNVTYPTMKSNNLTNASVVRITCASTYPEITNTAESRIEVIPSFQEI